MRRVLAIAVIGLAFTAMAQVTYWFQGFQRQQSAPLARAYLGTAWLATNSPPTNAYVGGAAYLWNSNSVIYLITSSPGSNAWASTNKLAP